MHEQAIPMIRNVIATVNRTCLHYSANKLRTRKAFDIIKRQSRGAGDASEECDAAENRYRHHTGSEPIAQSVTAAIRVQETR